MKLAALPLPSVTLPVTLKSMVPLACSWPTTVSPAFWKAILPLEASTSSRLMAPLLEKFTSPPVAVRFTAPPATWLDRALLLVPMEAPVTFSEPAEIGVPTASAAVVTAPPALRSTAFLAMTELTARLPVWVAVIAPLVALALAVRVRSLEVLARLTVPLRLVTFRLLAWVARAVPTAPTLPDASMTTSLPTTLPLPWVISPAAVRDTFLSAPASMPLSFRPAAVLAKDRSSAWVRFRVRVPRVRL